MFGTLKTAKRISGSSNSKLYQLIGSGQIKAKKLGRRLLIDLGSLYTFLESLPDAKIAPPRPRRSKKQAPVNDRRPSPGGTRTDRTGVIADACSR
jgi:hypothetical protein